MTDDQTSFFVARPATDRPFDRLGLEKQELLRDHAAKDPDFRQRYGPARTQKYRDGLLEEYARRIANDPERYRDLMKANNIPTGNAARQARFVERQVRFDPWAEETGQTR